MSLPHPNIVFTPLTTITAQDHNNQMANVASLADGTGVNDGAIVGDKLKEGTITADKIDFTTIPGNKYTTTEQDTGKKWIDGKTIYRKTFEVNTKAQGNVEQIIDIDLPKKPLQIIKVEGGIRAGADFYPLEYINPNAPSGQNSQLKLTRSEEHTSELQSQC